MVESAAEQVERVAGLSGFDKVQSAVAGLHGIGPKWPDIFWIDFAFAGVGDQRLISSHLGLVGVERILAIAGVLWQCSRAFDRS